MMAEIAKIILHLAMSKVTLACLATPFKGDASNPY
jgi:hypothetical protein